MNQNSVITYTQSILAIIVVVGGGFFLFFKGSSNDSITIAIVGIIGTVLGWYFRGAAESQFSATKIQEAEAAKGK